MSTQPQQQPTTTTTTSSSSTSSTTRPPVTLPPTTHLDPGAYIRGTHPITLGENNLIHPRALLTTTTHPLILGNNNIISEKAILGGSPASSSNNNIPSTATNPSSNLASPSLSNPPTPNLALPSPTSASSTTARQTGPTTLHSNIHIHPSAQISHSATIHSFTTIDSHAVIYPGVVVGAHSKVCAGVHVRSDVPEWMVVFGDGGLRRSRKPTSPMPPAAGSGAERNGVLKGSEEDRGDSRDVHGGSNGNVEIGVGNQLEWQSEVVRKIEEAETHRVRGVDREREAATILLRNAARAAVAAKRASVQR